MVAPERLGPADWATLGAAPVMPEPEAPVDTHRDNVVFLPGVDRGSNAQARRAGARARLVATESVGKIFAGAADLARMQWEKAGRIWRPSTPQDVAIGHTVWSEPPESLAEHWAYVRAGRWSDTPLLVVLGRLYGTAVLIVSTPVLGGLWIARRPARLLVALVVGVIVWLTI